MSETIQGIIYGALITSLVAPLVLLLLNRALKKSGRTEDLNAIQRMQIIYENQIKRNADLEGRLATLESMQRGPFRMILEFQISPEPEILNSHIGLMENSPTKPR